MTNDLRPIDAAGELMRTPMELAGSMLDAITEGARVYWSFWGPLGEPAIIMVEMCADAHRAYLTWWADAVSSYGPAR